MKKKEDDEMKPFVLGNEVVDVVTGVRGIATCRAEHLNGCTQIGIALPAKKDGGTSESHFCDEQQVNYVGPGVVGKLRKRSVEDKEIPGGPHPAPVRSASSGKWGGVPMSVKSKK